MAMMALMGMKQKGIRCVLVVVDRCALATQAKQEFADFFAKCYKIPVAKQKTEHVPEVLQVSAASELQQHFDKLTEDSLARCVLVVTLQSFPHLQTTLPPALQETTGESLKKKVSNMYLMPRCTPFSTDAPSNSHPDMLDYHLCNK
jgi:type I site-specific restriction-modification system R (restriction) subunit